MHDLAISNWFCGQTELLRDAEWKVTGRVAKCTNRTSTSSDFEQSQGRIAERCADEINWY